MKNMDILIDDTDISIIIKDISLSYRNKDICI